VWYIRIFLACTISYFCVYYVVCVCYFPFVALSFSTLMLLVGSFDLCKPSPGYNLYCVGGDVKHCSIQFIIYCFLVLFYMLPYLNHGWQPWLVNHKRTMFVNRGLVTILTSSISTTFFTMVVTTWFTYHGLPHIWLKSVSLTTHMVNRGK